MQITFISSKCPFCQSDLSLFELKNFAVVFCLNCSKALNQLDSSTID